MSKETEFDLEIDDYSGASKHGRFNVHVSDGVEYYYIDGVYINTLRLPKDDQVLANIIDICQQLIDRPFKPLTDDEVDKILETPIDNEKYSDEWVGGMYKRFQEKLKAK